MNEEKLWKIENIGEYFQTTPDTVYRKIVCRPTFPRPIKIPGGPKRWKPEEVKEWAESMRG